MCRAPQLARAAQRRVALELGRADEPPLLFEVTCQNADKGAVDAAALRRRIARIVAGGAANATSSSVAAMGSWSVAVTSASLFLDKV